MMNGNRFSRVVSVFHGIETPEEGYVVGYGAIIEALALPVPLPRELSLVSLKNRTYQTEGWRVFASRLLPEDSLYKQLVFAIKYEGIQLLVFKKLFEALPKNEVVELISLEPLGQYARRIWFLYEWLMGEALDVEDLASGNYVPLLNPDLQYSVVGTRSQRHRIVNNLPGTPGFCPLIFQTDQIQAFSQRWSADVVQSQVSAIRKDVLQRAAAFLMLRDSKASFTIEGESPKSQRAAKWGRAIGQAGNTPLSKEELLRLQALVIGNSRFLTLGFRKEGGFVGEHDRMTGLPIPDHISARWDQVEELVDGLLATNQLLANSQFDPVMTAVTIAFGFVFIHPFADGNGRIHRYLLHHVLAKMGYTPQGVVFPISAAILDRIGDYREVLESYSLPLLDHIEWNVTSDHNIEVLNDTADYYRYFDATMMAEFIYTCVGDTIERIIPQEVEYLLRYDEFKRSIEEEWEMPEKLIATLLRFLDQNAGHLSQRARKKEFSMLSDEEIRQVEDIYQMVFLSGS